MNQGWVRRFDQHSRHSSMLLGLLLLIGMILIAGCSKQAVKGESYLASTVPPPVEDAPYVLAPGDEMDIRFYHTPQLNVQLPVRPDGFISLPLAYELQAAGRTPEELRQEITTLYAAELNDPEVAVIVREFSQQRIHVGGEVEDPGVFPLVDSMTVLDSLFEAGGLLRTAYPQQVIVIRREVTSEGPQPLVIALDMASVLNGSDLSQDIALRPHDAIFVPTSGIADVNTFVDQYIRQNIPISFSLRLGNP